MIIYVSPESGQFDVASVEEFVDRLPNVVVDPLDPSVRIVCLHEVAEQYALDLRSQTPPRYPSFGLVRIEGRLVTVSHNCTDEHFPRLREVIDYLKQIVPCRIKDDFGNDWTEATRDSLDPIYESSD